MLNPKAKSENHSTSQVLEEPLKNKYELFFVISYIHELFTISNILSLYSDSSDFLKPYIWTLNQPNVLVDFLKSYMTLNKFNI